MSHLSLHVTLKDRGPARRSPAVACLWGESFALPAEREGFDAVAANVVGMPDEVVLPAGIASLEHWLDLNA